MSHRELVESPRRALFGNAQQTRDSPKGRSSDGDPRRSNVGQRYIVGTMSKSRACPHDDTNMLCRTPWHVGTVSFGISEQTATGFAVVAQVRVRSSSLEFCACQFSVLSPHASASCQYGGTAAPTLKDVLMFTLGEFRSCFEETTKDQPRLKLGSKEEQQSQQRMCVPKI